MFMVKENNTQKEQLEKLYKKIKALYGQVPPQMKMLGNIEVTYLENFLKMAMGILKHPNIQPDFFAFLRLHIAFKENYAYCKMFNTQLLLKKGYIQEQIDAVVTDLSTLPLDKKHQLLAEYALKAIYESSALKEKNFEEIYTLGWSQKDVFDAIEHAGTIFKNGRILTAYAKK